MRTIAKVYLPHRKDGLIYVSYRDPSQREASGRSKRVIKWFRKNQKTEARAYARELNERIMREGTVGAAYDSGLRKDACAASAFCSWLVEREWLSVNPVKGVRKPDVLSDREKPAAWSVEGLRRLLAAARDYAGGRFCLRLWL